MCLAPQGSQLADLLIAEYLDSDGYLLPGRRFPFPKVESCWNGFASGLDETAPGREFPVSYFQIIRKGEPLYCIGDEGGRKGIDYEWYVGFLPVDRDGTLPPEGIDWWSWEHGRSVEPEKWVRPSFGWSETDGNLGVSFSNGTLMLSDEDQSDARVDFPYEVGYFGGFDSTTRRCAVVGYDDERSEWHLSVLDEKGRVLFQDPWDTRPTSHLHPSDGGTALLYAVWEDETTATRRPHIHPIQKGQPRRPVHPQDHPSLGVYRVSLRTGRVTKEPGLVQPERLVQSTPDRCELRTYSSDRTHFLSVGMCRDNINVVQYYDATVLDSPTRLWERWENRLVQRAAIFPGGRYVAKVMTGAYWPDGPGGRKEDDFSVAVLKVTTREGHVLGTHTYSSESHPYCDAVVFDGPYLIVGYDGSGRFVYCVHLYDMRVPWNTE